MIWKNWKYKKLDYLELEKIFVQLLEAVEFVPISSKQSYQYSAEIIDH